MARENIFTEFDLDASDPDSIEKMMRIARGEDHDEEYDLSQLNNPDTDENLVEFLEERY